MTRARALFAVLALGVAFAAFSAPAYADDGWGDGIEVIPDDQMQDLRGGVGIPGVPNLNFSIVVTTFLNGNPVVITQLTVNDAGEAVKQTVGDIGENIANLTQDQLGALGLAGLANAAGVVISDDSGITALVHNINDGSLQNIIVNTASGRDLSQSIDMTLDLPGFQPVQNAIQTDRLGINLVADLTPHLD